MNPISQSSRQTLEKRRQKKARTLETVVSQLETLTDSPLYNSYMDTCGCCKTMLQEDGKITSTYCKRRWCIVCNSIRTATYINKFGPKLEEDTADGAEYFYCVVTLPTRPHNGHRLSKLVQDLYDAVDRAKRSLKRTDGVSFDAFTKLEVTYCEKRDKYHPHLNIVIKGKENASLLIKKYLKFASKIGYNVSRKAQTKQQIKTCDDLVEVFKYVTKFGDKDKDGTYNVYPAKALDTIFRTLHGKRLVRTYGEFYGYEPAPEETADEEIGKESTIQPWKRKDETINWNWDSEESDWIDRKTGEFLVADGVTEAPETAPLDTLAQAPQKGSTSPPVREKGNKERSERDHAAKQFPPNTAPKTVERCNKPVRHREKPAKEFHF
jgi:hypothetical protein